MPFRSPPLRPHQDDVLISASGLLGGGVLWGLGLHNSPASSGLPNWLSLVALVIMSGAELLRRTAPQTGLAIATGALALDVLTGTLVTTVLMYSDLVYAAVLYGSPRAARRIPHGCHLITALITVATLVIYRDPAALLLGFATAMITIVPAWTGTIIRNHREVAQAARLEAERTALLAELDRREAITSERARMARELHDMVAGHLSAIAIHSTAALSLGDPKAANDALGVIRENSVQGLAEMRRLIGLLRDATGETEPAVAPTLDGLQALITRAGRTGEDNGLRFELNEEGDGAAHALPAPVELAAYRIVQEALTNALKHAGPGEVRVRLSRTAPGPLYIEVSSALGDRDGPRAPGSGAGLVGMRERAALLGGTFEAGPQTAGQDKIWRVRAVLPVDEETRG
ncbi:sensor histidine kinase [Streptomyces zagrosensis]|uniref:histidine kinase n=1 Tax=Streptomyces zagrosensis TaxID=1042984 RepID=A0A7W9QB31_9ACTN|nr:histidine kinase [Streptomyces zagrosensis]MBB5935767.1 signal transduction histidine kinase [Streptomyces zagrosensis]